MACSARERAQAEVAMTMIAREMAVPVRIIVREGYTRRMESLFRGNVTEVKVVLTSVAWAASAGAFLS